LGDVPKRLKVYAMSKEGVRGHNVGSSDYSKHKIQPWDIGIEYRLNPWDADIIKRVLRKKGDRSQKIGL
jgi:hypothetical protein